MVVVKINAMANPATMMRNMLGIHAPQIFLRARFSDFR